MKNTTIFTVLFLFLFTGTVFSYDPIPLKHPEKNYKDEKTGSIYMNKSSGYLNLTKVPNPDDTNTIQIGRGKSGEEIKFVDDGEYEVIINQKKETTKIRKGKKVKRTIKKEITRFSVFVDNTKPRSFLKYNDTYIMLGKSPVFGGSVSINIEGTDNSNAWQSGVDSLYYSINSDDYQKYEGSINLYEQGVYEIRYYAVDNVGNIETPNRIKLIIDQTPPYTTLVFDNFSFENSYFSPLSKIKLRATDDGAGTKEIFYNLNNGTFKKFSDRIKLGRLPVGKNSLSYYSVDRVGNKEAPRTFDFYLDNTIPTVSFSEEGPSFSDGNNLYITKQTKLNIIGKDTGSGVRDVFYNFNNDTNWSVYYEPITVKETLKLQRLNYWVSDNVNNKTGTMSQKIVIDNDLPTVSLKIDTDYYKAGETYYVSDKTEIDLITFDKTSGVKEFYYSLDEAPYKSKKPIVINQSGKHNLSIVVIDNVDIENTRDFSINVDTGLPQVELGFSISPIDTQTSGGTSINVYPKKTTVYLSATDTESGVSNIFYKVDNRRTEVYTRPLIFQNSGQHSIQVYAKDKVGNKSGLKTVNFVIR